MPQKFYKAHAFGHQNNCKNYDVFINTLLTCAVMPLERNTQPLNSQTFDTHRTCAKARGPADLAGKQPWGYHTAFFTEHWNRNARQMCQHPANVKPKKVESLKNLYLFGMEKEGGSEM